MGMTKRKSKKHQVFVGSGRSLVKYRQDGVTSSTVANEIGPASQATQRVLHSFCEKFIVQCYGPTMKCLKNEFRRDSGRLEEEDKIMFFQIVWFFSQWWRVSHQG